MHCSDDKVLICRHAPFVSCACAHVEQPVTNHNNRRFQLDSAPTTCPKACWLFCSCALTTPWASITTLFGLLQIMTYKRNKCLTTSSRLYQFYRKRLSLDQQSLGRVFFCCAFFADWKFADLLSYAWFPALRFRSSVAVSPCSVSKVRKNYIHP